LRNLVCVIRGGGNVEALSESSCTRSILGALSLPGSANYVATRTTTHFLELVSPYLWIPLSRGHPHFYLHRFSYFAWAKFDGVLGDISSEIFKVATNMPIRVASFSEVVRLLEERFGRNWTATEIALISGAVRDRHAQGGGAYSLFDTTQPLTSRVRFAKRRPADGAWWLAQVEDAKDALDRAFWLAVTYIWADPLVIEAALDCIDKTVRALPTDLTAAVAVACQRAVHYSNRATRELCIPFERLLDETLHQRTRALLSARISQQDARVVPAVFCELREPWIASTCLRIATRLWCDGEMGTDDFLHIAERAQNSGGGADFDDFRGSSLSRRIRDEHGQLLKYPRQLPEGLLFGAVRASAHMKKPKPLLPIAMGEGWL
jgi:hypothetical protein